MNKPANQTDLSDLQAELTALRARVDQLTTEQQTSRDKTVSRRRLLTGLAGLGAAGAAGVATAAPAGAADGDNLVLGQVNDTANGVLLRNGAGAELPELPSFEDPLMRFEDHQDGNAVTAVSTDTAMLAAGTIVGIDVYGGFSGVTAHTDGAVAVGALASDLAAAVLARAGDGPALVAESDLGVHLLLTPTAVVGPPTASWSEDDSGAISVDEHRDVWLCVTGGDAPVWTKLLREDTATGRTVPIAPLRAIDTRSPGGRPPGSPVVPGQTAGPRAGGTSITLDLAGIDDIPATATGVIGNLTVVGPTYTGYLVARPSGDPSTTSSLNFPKGVTALANAFTSQLGPAGLTITSSGTTANTHHLVVDITAYIT